MKSLALSLAALLALAPASLAQEGAPAPKKEEAPAAPAAEKHVNKVSDAAKAAFEAAEKLLYSPVGLGLKELKGTIEMKMQMAGMEEEVEGMPQMGMSFTIEFKAPREMTVGAKGGEMFGPGAGENMARSVKSLVLNSMGVIVPAGDDEYDADIVTENGKKILILTSYEKNVKQGEMRMTIGDNGLPTTGDMTMIERMPGGRTMEQKGKMGWVFAKDGDLWRLEKQTIEVPMAPAPMEYRIEYSEAGGFKVPTKFLMDMGGMAFGYRFTELTVNGKVVDLGGAKDGAPKTATPKAEEGGKGEKGGEGEKEDGEDDGM